MTSLRALVRASAVAVAVGWLGAGCVVNTKDYPLARSTSGTGPGGTSGLGGGTNALGGHAGGIAGTATNGGNAGQGATGCDTSNCPVACSNGVKDDSETDVDCGGTCAPGSRCSDGNQCLGNSDCLSSVCTAGRCTTPPATIVLVDSDAGGKSTSAFSVEHALKTPAGHDRLVVIAVAAQGNSASGASPDVVKYADVTATLALGQWSGNQAWVGVFFVDEASLPTASGTYSVSVGGFEFAAAASVIEFTGVDQVNPISTAVGGTGLDCCCDDPSDAITVTVENSWLISAVGAFGSGTASPLSEQTLARTTTIGGLGFVAGYRGPESTTGSKTITWDLVSCNDTAHVLVALKPK